MHANKKSHLESMLENLMRLMDALQKIWRRIGENVVIVDKRRIPINVNSIMESFSNWQF